MIKYIEIFLFYGRWLFSGILIGLGIGMLAGGNVLGLIPLVFSVPAIHYATKGNLP